MGKWHASSDAGQKYPISQQPWSNSSVKKEQLIMYKDGIFWWEKKSMKDYHDINSKPYIQTILPFTRVNKGHIL